MKNNKGITLMSLIIYLTIFSLVISMLAVVSNFFFANTKYITENSKYVSEFNKFNMYFIEDTKKNKNIKEMTRTSLVFEDGTTYTYKKSPDNGIYRNKVKICSNIAYCSFLSSTKETNGVIKKIITVQTVIKGSKLVDISNDYVLKYW